MPHAEIVEPEYENVQTLRAPSQFANYNLPAHTILQTYNSKRANKDKLFEEEFKVSSLLFIFIKNSAALFKLVKSLCVHTILMIFTVLDFLFIDDERS